MTAPRSTDQLLQAFLADGLTELPDRTYEAVRREIHVVRQGGRVAPKPVRDLGFGRWLGVAVAAAVILAVGVLDLRLGGGPGGVPTPAATETLEPSVAPSVTATLGLPTTFTSPLYGYAVTVPAGWIAAAAIVPWDRSAEPGPFAETDRFAGPEELTGWAYAGPFDRSLDALVADRIAATHRDHADTCPVIQPEVNERIDIGGAPWVLLGWNCGALINEAVTIHAGVAYVFVFRDLAIRAATDPADRALFGSILESVVLPD
jgi:hypothetical protein